MRNLKNVHFDPESSLAEQSHPILLSAPNNLEYICTKKEKVIYDFRDLFNDTNINSRITICTLVPIYRIVFGR